MYKIQSPQPQKPTHPHQVRWKVVSHPPPQRTLEGSLQYCFLTWLHVEITQGEPGEILMPAAIQTEMAWGVDWELGCLKAAPGDSNIMYSRFQNHCPRPKLPSLLVRGKA